MDRRAFITGMTGGLLAAPLAARAIREEKNIATVVTEILEAAARRA